MVSADGEATAPDGAAMASVDGEATASDGAATDGVGLANTVKPNGVTK